MNLPLSAIEMDGSIQCRATIDMAVVGEYAERMGAGDEFPAVDLFGTKSKCWIGDGWHRVMAARQCGAETITATVHSGGRAEALKHALGANALHGHRRSNADKRRCVEIAFREFPKLSSRAVAKLCGVSDPFVSGMRPAAEVQTVSTCTGQDGKQYPAHRKPQRIEPSAGIDKPTSGQVIVAARAPLPKTGPPADGMQFARMALMDLEQIREDDVERAAAFRCVWQWLTEHSRGEM